ncbi:hypothetical protein ORF083 [Pseudomonas phage M6]|uniref:Uncharacterized protein n=1 Tax=Pseudomonas phage LKO4 TaxID=1308899 RepID=A0A0U1UKX3_9CAUD|nr:hypothetical protein ORF083 [Pseudomonas phage M6]YP_009601833.1 hypothetical protein FDH51_gp46 [Pseudomonas phage LKO4]AGI11282.1 hypothetical protein LKO4_0039.2 [Pseudomonas phage LKO4]
MSGSDRSGSATSADRIAADRALTWANPTATPINSADGPPETPPRGVRLHLRGLSVPAPLRRRSLLGLLHRRGAVGVALWDRRLPPL